jgi:hypothetical protein
MASERLIMVIQHCEERGRSLKEQIEFMDAPRVEVARPAEWRHQLGDSRLAAVFISDDVSTDERDRLISDIGDLDPNTPIVMVAADHGDGRPNA